MAITYWPKHGQANTEQSFAQYCDKLIGYADHCAGDSEFMLKFTSTAGGTDTYTLTAGSYFIDGYMFTAAGTETVTAATGSTISIYLSYHLNGSVIDACGIYNTSQSGYVNTVLWTVLGGKITQDNRKMLTWGRSSYDDTTAGCVDIISTGERALTGATSWALASVCKRFRCGYAGSFQLTYEAKTASADEVDIYRYRGTTATLLTSQATTTAYPSSPFYNYVVEGCQPGDYIDIQGASAITTYVRNFRIRYRVQDTPTSQVVLD